MTDTTARNWKLLYPFASNFLEVPGGHRMHYLDEGTGPALLMVHGNPTWSFYWRRLVRTLRGEFRVVVPDHIGCGLSDKPVAGEYPYRLGRRIEDLVRLIETLDLTNVTLLVHDWGGAIGLGAAGRLPERVAGQVIFNSGSFHGGRCPLRIRVCRMPILGGWGVRGLNLFARAAARMTTYRTKLAPNVAAGLLAPYDTWANRVAVEQFVRDIPLSPGHPSYDTLSQVDANLSKLADRPTSLIWGMRDWCFTPWFLGQYEKRFPGAEVHRIEDAGHYVIEDAHEDVETLVRDFLARM